MTLQPVTTAPAYAWRPLRVSVTAEPRAWMRDLWRHDPALLAAALHSSGQCCFMAYRRASFYLDGDYCTVPYTTPYIFVTLDPRDNSIEVCVKQTRTLTRDTQPRDT